MRIFVATATLCCLASTAISADVTGTWRSEKSAKGGYMDVKFYECGEKTCGKMVKAYRHTGEPNPEFPGQGKQLVTGMSSKDGKNFSGGTIIHAESGMKFKGTMTKDGDKLVLKGCALGKTICKNISFFKK